MKKIKEFRSTFEILFRNVPGSHGPTKRRKVKTLVMFIKKNNKKKRILKNAVQEAVNLQKKKSKC